MRNIIPEEVQEAYSGLVGWEAAEEEPGAVYKIVAKYLNLIEFEEDLHTEEFPYLNSDVARVIEVVRFTYSDEFRAEGIGRTT